MHTGREMVLSEGTQHWVSRGEKRLLSLFDQCRSFNLFHFLPVFTSWTFYYLIPLLMCFLLFSETLLFLFSRLFLPKKRFIPTPRWWPVGSGWAGIGACILVLFFWCGNRERKKNFRYPLCFSFQRLFIDLCLSLSSLYIPNFLTTMFPNHHLEEKEKRLFYGYIAPYTNLCSSCGPNFTLVPLQYLGTKRSLPKSRTTHGKKFNQQ